MQRHLPTRKEKVRDGNPYQHGIGAHIILDSSLASGAIGDQEVQARQDWASQVGKERVTMATQFSGEAAKDVER